MCLPIAEQRNEDKQAGMSDNFNRKQKHEHPNDVESQWIDKFFYNRRRKDQARQTWKLFKIFLNFCILNWKYNRKPPK